MVSHHAKAVPRRLMIYNKDRILSVKMDFVPGGTHRISGKMEATLT